MSRVFHIQHTEPSMSIRLSAFSSIHRSVLLSVYSSNCPLNAYKIERDVDHTHALIEEQTERGKIGFFGMHASKA